LLGASRRLAEAKEANGFPVQGWTVRTQKFLSSQMGAPEKRPRTVSAALSLATGAVSALAATFLNCQADGSLVMHSSFSGVKLFSLLQKYGLLPEAAQRKILRN
jgi:hypothetical protein